MDEEADGKWEYRTRAPQPGRLLRFRMGIAFEPLEPGNAGVSISLHAAGPEDEDLAAVEQTVFQNENAPKEEEIRLQLLVPEGAATVKAKARSWNVGQIRFGPPSLEEEDVDPERLNGEMIDRVKSDRPFRSLAVERAFRSVLRHPFLPEKNWGEVYTDRALVIRMKKGEAVSSSSQPTMMAIMLEQLKIEPGMTILEIGAGTGYNAALLARLAGETGHVRTIDLEPSLCEEAREHLKAAGVEGVEVICGDGWAGYPEGAPYDRIIATAQASDLAPAWFEQLREGGLLVVPWAPLRLSWPNLSLAFRKIDGKLVQEDQTACGFMAMRGAIGGRQIDSRGGRWLSSGLTAEEAESLGELISAEPWEREFPGPKVTDFGSLVFFLAVEDPRVVVLQRPPGEGRIEMLAGWVGPDRSSAALLAHGETLRIVGWGDDGPARELEGLLRRWFDRGQPDPTRLRLAAHPAAEGAERRAGERVVRRRGFDFEVDWA